MEGPVKGEVVVIAFPFSDLSQMKRRPALVLAEASPQDLILCEITTRRSPDPFAVPLLDSDFVAGALRHDSFIRPTRLFTAHRRLIITTAGRLKPAKLDQVIESLIALLQSG